jgi:hypothetical protein
MAGATLRVVLGQPTTPLVVQHRSRNPSSGSVIVGTEGWTNPSTPFVLYADKR